MNLRTTHPTTFARLNFKPARRGFTLVELMVAIGLAALIMLMTLMIMRGANQARAVTQARLNAGEAARVFFGTFERDFAAATPGPFFSPPDSTTPSPWRKYDLVDSSFGPTAYWGDMIGFPTSLTDYSSSEVLSNPAYQSYHGSTTLIPITVSTVRYFVVPGDPLTSYGLLCREVSLAQNHDIARTITAADGYPFLVTPPPAAADYVLLANISDLRGSYLYWNATEGQYYYYNTPTQEWVSPIDSTKRISDITLSLATHLNIALTTYDPTPGLPMPRRSFQKILPIPAGFQ